MKKYSIALVWLIILAVFMTACGGEKKLSETNDASAYFPEESQTTDVKKVSDVTTYAGQSLFEYII